MKRMLQSDTLKNPDFAMSAKEQLLRGVLGCLVNKEKRKGKGKKNLREGRTCSESSPSLKDFYCYQLEGGENLSRKFSPSSKAFNVINLLLFFLTEERSRAFFV